MPNPDNVIFYDSHAKSLADRYDSIATEQALPFLVRILENDHKKGNILDIGSGSGRDALWFAERGWNVSAIDASPALLSEAEQRNPNANIRYYIDVAPQFLESRKDNKQYDLIVMSAFIFHFDNGHRNIIMKNCLDMLAPDGLMHFTLRQGPLIEGRNIFCVNPEEIINFANAHNLSCKHHGRMIDASNLTNIEWDHITIWRGTRWAHAESLSA